MSHPPARLSTEHLAARLHGWHHGPGPRYLRLAEALRELVDTGAVTQGTRLPSERALAAALQVSRNTVTAAYRQLRDAGWLVGRQGAATQVGATMHLNGDAVSADPLADLFGDGPRPRLDLTIASPAPAPAVLDALAGLPDLMSETVGSQGGLYPAGHPLLLEAIAQKLRHDGIAAHPDEIVVTSGAQQALALVAEALHRPRRPVAVEAVTFPGLIDAIRRRGRPRLVTLPVDHDGLQADAAARLVRATRPAAAYLTSFHNPTGSAIGAEGGRALLDAATAARTTVVEDRVLADLPLDGAAAPTPLAAMPSDAAVTTVGSVSKVLWGGLRIGWIHTNRTLASHLRARRRALDLGSPAPMQFAAAWLLRHHYDDVREWRIECLRTSLAALTDALDAADLGWRYRPPAGGPSLWIRLPHADARAFAERAARDGVPVVPGSAFTVNPGTAADSIRIPFYLPPEDLDTAVATLAGTWRRHMVPGRGRA
ncbi:aminotransferase-like domain-containing protein [Glycomyces salinus]|uniref:aminotransferase-like domain-containing protein n=1 Tax=Glycomyces salinus TaxID=980294 RepID=UPI0018ECDDE5|nr:PLP-dependent aminotransferase family protein [Glycomyces salinus]